MNHHEEDRRSSKKVGKVFTLDRTERVELYVWAALWKSDLEMVDDCLAQQKIACSDTFMSGRNTEFLVSCTYKLVFVRSSEMLRLTIEEGQMKVAVAVLQIGEHCLHCICCMQHLHTTWQNIELASIYMQFSNSAASTQGTTDFGGVDGGVKYQTYLYAHPRSKLSEESLLQ